MKRLEEIKNEYAQTLEFKDWDDLRRFHILEDVPGLEEFENEVTYLYTKECVKASLEKASEKIYDYIELNSQEGSDIVNNPENIVLL